MARRTLACCSSETTTPVGPFMANQVSRSMGEKSASSLSRMSPGTYCSRMRRSLMGSFIKAGTRLALGNDSSMSARWRAVSWPAWAENFCVASSGVGREGTLLFRGLADHLAGGKSLSQFPGLHTQASVPRQLVVQDGVGNACRVQLLIDPLTRAHRQDSFKVARPRAKRKSLERVQGSVVIGERRGLDDLGFLVRSMGAGERHERE